MNMAIGEAAMNTTTAMTASAGTTERRFLEGVVSNLAMFRDVPPAQLGRLIGQCRALSVRRGAPILQRGARPAGMFAVAYGSFQLVLGRGADEKRIVRLVSAGETIGTATALRGRPSRYDAVALVDSKVVTIPTTAILGLVERDPPFARRMVMHLADSTLRMLDEVEAATLQPAAQRLASYLASLTAHETEPDTVRLPVSKTVVAARLGVKKATLSRLLRGLAHEGLIAVAQREISILDRPRLSALAQA